MDYRDIVLNGENLSVPLWQCGLCPASGEAATAAAAQAATLDHIRTAHPDTPFVLPAECN